MEIFKKALVGVILVWMIFINQINIYTGLDFSHNTITLSPVLTMKNPYADFSPEQIEKELKKIRYNWGYQWDKELMPIHEKAEKMASAKEVTLEEFTALMAEYKAYLKGGKKQAQNTAKLGLRKNEAVAYYSMEHGITNLINVYSGGLGVLSGCHSRGASDEWPNGVFVAIGPCYREGYFQQYLDEHGLQKERYPRVHIEDFADFAKDKDGKDIIVTVKIPCNQHYVDVKVKAYEVYAGRVPLYLITTNIEENNKIYNPDKKKIDTSYRHIYDRLYVAGDDLARIMQEYILGIAGRKILKELGIKPVVDHLNEGHSGFLALEAVRQEMLKRAEAFRNQIEWILDIDPETDDKLPMQELLRRLNKEHPKKAKEYGLSFQQIRKIVASQIHFTSHTPVPAGNEYFSLNKVKPFLKAYADSLGIKPEEILKLGRVYSRTHNDIMFGLTEFVLNFSASRNAVSRRHKEVADTMYIKTDDVSVEELFLIKLADLPEVFEEGTQSSRYQHARLVRDYLYNKISINDEKLKNMLQKVYPKNRIHFEDKDFNELSSGELKKLIGFFTRTLFEDCRNDARALNAVFASLEKWEFDYITNAIHRVFWQPKQMQALFEKYLKIKHKQNIYTGKSVDDLNYKEFGDLLKSIPNQDIINTKKQMKKQAAEHLKEIRPHSRLEALDPDAFTIVIARRFATYKRGDLILKKAEQIIKDAKKRGVNVQIVFAGKAHPEDKYGKRIIQNIWNYKQPRYPDNIFFVENYEIDAAKDLIALADVWHNNPEPPREASGTSGMKPDALTVSTPDGWVLEALKSTFFFVTIEEMEQIYTGKWRFYSRHSKQIIEPSEAAIQMKEREKDEKGTWWECMDAAKEDSCRKIFFAPNTDSDPVKCPSCGRPAIRPSTVYEWGIIDIWKNHPNRWAELLKTGMLERIGNFNAPRFIQEYADKAYIPIIQKVHKRENQPEDINIDIEAVSIVSSKSSVEAKVRSFEDLIRRVKQSNCSA